MLSMWGIVEVCYFVWTLLNLNYKYGVIQCLPYHRKFAIREDVFRSKSEDDQKKFFFKFLKYTPRPPLTVVSTDGKTSVPAKLKTVATKPGQRERSRKERTKAKKSL